MNVKPVHLFKGIATTGGLTLLSRVFGFVRDILMAGYLGAGTLSDAFVVAFRLPNLFRRLFAEGAFAAAFVPIFSRTLEGEGREKALEFSDQAFSLLLVILSVFTVLMQLVMPWVVLAMAGGFADVPGKLELSTELARIAFPYLLFISLVSLQSGVLNSVGRFAAAAAAPVLLNLTMIAALLGFADRLDTPAHALTWGVFAAGIVQFIWLAWACRKDGVPVRFVRPRLTEKIRLLFRRILPVVFGASVYQINLLVGTALATYVLDGAASYLYYADRLTQLPLGVIGVAVGIVLLPLISRQLEAGDHQVALQSQNRGLEFALLLTLPATGALIIIPEPIIQVLFQRGAFGSEATQATASALLIYATGLPAYVMIKVLAPGFFAREDTTTPVKIAVYAMGLNIVLNFALMPTWGYQGIAAAAALSGWVNAIALFVVLVRRGHFALDDRLRWRLPRLLLSTLGMVGVLKIIHDEWAFLWLKGSQVEGIVALIIMIAAGAAAFFGFAFALRAVKKEDVTGYLKRGSS